MTQEWVNKLMAATVSDVSVVGRLPEDDERDSWTLRFVAKLVSVGIPINFALEIYSYADRDFSENPEDAAIGELDGMC
jgi:hypothetical protein